MAMKGILIWWFRAFERAIWLVALIAIPYLAVNGFYWGTLAAAGFFYFGLPMVFIQVRKRLGLPPIPGEPDPAEECPTGAFRRLCELESRPLAQPSGASWRQFVISLRATLPHAALRCRIGKRLTLRKKET